MKYIKRCCDKELDLKINTFGAVHITGPKWCGKTTTAKQIANSIIEMQDPDTREANIKTAEILPSKLLEGAKPRLIDEWQICPNLWDAVRVAVDRSQNEGQYILTGSNSIDKTQIMHTGTGRIDSLQMQTMSLYESGESTGEVSLAKLFDDKDSFKGCESNLTIDELIFAACRGGWPASLRQRSNVQKLLIAQSYYNSLCAEDMNSLDGVKRNKTVTRLLLREFARNISTPAKNSVIIKDVNANINMSETTFYEYVNVLNKLFVLQNIPAWNPNIRSKTAIISTSKIEFVDPSIAISALGASPESFDTDLNTFGYIFECLCCRDLKVYSSLMNGHISYYRDRYGLESDFVLHLNDGRYALVEVKLGAKYTDEGASNLNRIEALINKNNKNNNRSIINLPTLKIVLTGSKYGYVRDDNVIVIPIGCLGP